MMCLKAVIMKDICTFKDPLANQMQTQRLKNLLKWNTDSHHD